ncbi:MAG: isoaspartyl peptidase/L-asparaginase [Planctomycetota bacterium]|nr:isoaspartyl peptidase/L-asparaginase [Planctomycetota bacterium]
MKTLPSLLLLSLAACASPLVANDSDAPHPAPGFAIVIHGGAGSPSRSMSAAERAAIVGGLEHALTLGRDALESGAGALEVVELVIRSLEDDPNFNSGRGAVYTAEERHELDASIMDGATLACGAVGGVTTVRHPITLARLVMTETRHVLFVAEGAEAFADTQPVERVDNSWFDTEPNRAYLHRVLEERRSAGLLDVTPAERSALDARAMARLAEEDAPASTFGTVGCAVLDGSGHLAAGTSTGGLTAKSFGRIGDSPIVGAGTYANDATCAVSATGVGEEFIRHGIARDISARMDYLGLDLDRAAAETMALLDEGVGGVVCVDHAGNITMNYNTTGMLRAAADAGGRFEVRIWEEVEDLD